MGIQTPLPLVGPSGNVLTSNGVIWNSQTPVPPVGLYLNTQTFTSSGSYTPSAGTSFIVVELVGGGGGGGAAGTSSARGSGGGGGGYARKKITSGFNGATVTVGAAGAGGVSMGAGGAGGTSSFGALVSATGGAGGNAETTGYTNPTNGGSGSGGDLNLYGDYAQLSGWGGVSGKGGNSFFGEGAKPQAINGVAGLVGVGYGAGGSAAIGNGSMWNGGAGTAGIVIIHEYK